MSIDNFLQSDRLRQHGFITDIADMQIETLTNAVIDIARNICSTLGAGLPVSVYRMVLLKQLNMLGLQLQTESSVLSRCANGEPEREIVIVEGRLVIECALSDEVDEVARKRLVFDVEANDYEVGVLINFGRGGLADDSSYKKKLLH